ncbi:U32 family peptidase C-terminal domain-containing protein [Candidatus Woesearchaeota archaeon]|nr:U32 family peptidase C-terminal domain-containing protein [Candidatus Woesearchaeota archaeon]
MKSKQTPELLMPAGDLEKAKFAFAFGADAVYAGVPLFSLRTKENKFNIDEIKEIIDYAHNLNKKVYVTTNIYPHNEKLEPFFAAIKELVKLGPDAFIVSDPGVIHHFRTTYPQVYLHLSVQQNNVNWASAQFWGSQGIKRIILARELTLDEIKTIVEKNPDMEFEAFVHGEMCIAYSGRCLLSNYLTGRDANQGACAQSCRWQYKVLEENLRPGEYHDAYEDENGTYIMNSKDLCAIEYLKELADIDICSFKVAGRNKGVNYVAIVAKTYRQAIDKLAKEETPDYESLIKELESVGNRGFIPGFLKGRPEEQGQRYDKNTMLQTHVFTGILTNYNKETKEATFLAKNKTDVGDTIQIITPTQTITHTITEMKNSEEQPITSIAPGAGKFTITLQEDQNIDSDFCIARRAGKQKRKE